MDRETKAYWRKIEKAYETNIIRWSLPHEERELRDKIDDQLQKILFDYVRVDVYMRSVKTIRAALDGIIRAASDAQQLCNELDAL